MRPRLSFPGRMSSASCENTTLCKTCRQMSTPRFVKHKQCAPAHQRRPTRPPTRRRHPLTPCSAQMRRAARPAARCPPAAIQQVTLWRCPYGSPTDLHDSAARCPFAAMQQVSLWLCPQTCGSPCGSLSTCSDTTPSLRLCPQTCMTLQISLGAGHAWPQMPPAACTGTPQEQHVLAARAA